MVSYGMMGMSRLSKSVATVWGIIDKAVFRTRGLRGAFDVLLRTRRRSFGDTAWTDVGGSDVLARADERCQMEFGRNIALCSKSVCAAARVSNGIIDGFMDGYNHTAESTMSRL